MSIRYIVAEVRHEKNMTQKQLAKKAGVSTAMISFIENDKRQPTFYVIALIAKALDVTVDELVVIKDDTHRFFK
ncbi:helix-turn-helix domain-containing protein [Megamonas hypermegale]|uniref:helix-turn-helix domain-containing protein n=1 Tax=Megamonas hypermegale TaxID=158847 RepID=UPI0026EEF909|nr:helix-turn-helix transcriptional regulator [Megamonas hypermegale]